MSDEVQAIITLTALTPNDFPSTRTIKLNPDNDIFDIGRASKSISKNLVAAADNGWVESPVMSRNHACLIFESFHKVISIEDHGSMHGTLVNGKQIRSHDPITLAKDDVVTFGAEVKRGSEVFPACRFRIAYEIQPWSRNTSRTFKVPSDTEDDYDSDVDISDDYDRSEARDEHTPVESPNPNGNKKSDTVDIQTCDAEVLEISHRGDVEPSNEPEPVTNDANSFTPMVESDNESHEDLESLLDSSDDEPSELPIDRSTPRMLSDEVGAAGLRPDIEVDGNSTGQDLLSDRCDLDSDEFDGDSLSSDFGEDDGDDSSLKANSAETPAIVPIHVGTLELLDTSKDTEQFTPPVEHVAPEQGCKDQHMRENILTQEQEIIVHNVEHSQLGSQNVPAEGRYPTPERHVPQLFQANSAKLGSMNMDIGITPRMLSIPSPSDAATGKSLTPIGKSSEFVASGLADKTSKREFFIAREENRARMQREGGLRCERDMYESTRMVGSSPPVGSQNPTPDNGPLKDVQPNFADGDAGFYNSVYGPRPDYISLAKRQMDMMKASISIARREVQQATHGTPETTQVKRSSVTINDIVDNDPVVEQPKSPKRKADAISELVEGEIDQWGAAKTSGEAARDEEPVRDHTAAPTVDTTAEAVAHVPQPTPAVQTAIETVTHATHPSVMAPPSQTTESHRSKRLKHFVEAFSYAALGGVVAGAGLFAALVSTAPDF